MTAQACALWHRAIAFHQEGLPAYWGIETIPIILFHQKYVAFIRKDYPLIGVLKLSRKSSLHPLLASSDQEGLPAYWGIETISFVASFTISSSVSGRITRLLGY